MPPVLRERPSNDYCQAPRSKRVKLDVSAPAPAPQSSRPKRSKPPPKKRTQALTVAPPPVTKLAPTARKRGQKNDKPPREPVEAPKRGRKRKRDADEDIVVGKEPEEPSIPQPLTKENLRAFDKAAGMAKTNASRQASRSAAKSSSRPGTTTVKITSQTKARQQLDAHRIHIDENLPKPPVLETLVKRLKEPDAPGRPARAVTPCSERVAENAPFIRRLQELTAQTHLQDALGYAGEKECKPVAECDNKKGIWRDFNRQWRRGGVPVVNGNDAQLRDSCTKSGIPSDPRPDIMYGHMERVLPPDMLDWFKAHAEVLVVDEGPLLPYWIVESKSTSTGGNLDQAEIQARRDGAAAVWAMYRMYQAWGIQEPAPEHTAVFSMCIDSSLARIRIHWRRVDDETISYEADTVASRALDDAESVYYMRSVIFKMLDWARDVRLPFIIQQFKELKPTANRTFGSVPTEDSSAGAPAVSQAGDEEDDGDGDYDAYLAELEEARAAAKKYHEAHGNLKGFAPTRVAGRAVREGDQKQVPTSVRDITGEPLDRRPLEALSVNSSAGDDAAPATQGHASQKENMGPPPKPNNSSPPPEPRNSSPPRKRRRVSPALKDQKSIPTPPNTS